VNPSRVEGSTLAFLKEGETSREVVGRLVLVFDDQGVLERHRVP